MRGTGLGFWDWIIGRGQGPEPAHTDAAAGRGDAGGAATAVLAPAGSPGVEAAEACWWSPSGAVLVEPVEMQRPELSLEALALENLLLAQFDGHDVSLPPLPRVPERVLKLLRSPECSFALIADAIAEDQVIAAMTLRMANSVLHRARRKITALQPAVTRIGANAVRTLMWNQSLRSAAFRHRGVGEELARTIWRRSLASASIMSGLASFAGLDAEEAFSIGLLHDIGNVMVLSTAARQGAIMHREIDTEAFEYLCYESHQELGELIADGWGLPPKLKALISRHHVAPSDDDAFRRERYTLELTDMINAMLGYAPSAAYNLLESRAVKALGLADRPGFVDFLTALPADVQQAIEVFE